jgi:hypothetical protein
MKTSNPFLQLIPSPLRHQKTEQEEEGILRNCPSLFHQWGEKKYKKTKEE